MNDRVLKEYWKLFCDIWRLFKKHRNVQTDDEWEQLVNEATILRKKYLGEFSRQMLMVILDELERKAKYEEETKRG